MGETFEERFLAGVQRQYARSKVAQDVKNYEGTVLSEIGQVCMHRSPNPAMACANIMAIFQHSHQRLVAMPKTKTNMLATTLEAYKMFRALHALCERDGLDGELKKAFGGANVSLASVLKLLFTAHTVKEMQTLPELPTLPWSLVGGDDENEGGAEDLDATKEADDKENESNDGSYESDFVVSDEASSSESSESSESSDSSSASSESSDSSDDRRHRKHSRKSHRSRREKKRKHHRRSSSKHRKDKKHSKEDAEKPGKHRKEAAAKPAKHNKEEDAAKEGGDKPPKRRKLEVISSSSSEDDPEDSAERVVVEGAASKSVEPTSPTAAQTP